MSIRVLIEPCALPVTVSIEAIASGGAGEAEVGEVEILDGEPEEATHIVRIELGGALRVRYSLAEMPTGLVDLTVMSMEQSNRLFLGGKRKSCVVDVTSDAVEHEFEHCLFWGFDLLTLPGYVLETGELDCVLRALDGTVLGTCSVDPPWEMFVEEGRLRFESAAQGTTYLPLPSAEASPTPEAVAPTPEATAPIAPPADQPATQAESPAATVTAPLVDAAG